MKSSHNSLTHLIEEHNHGVGYVYPDETVGAGTQMTSAAGAWNLSAAFTQIIPASTITNPFDIHYLCIEAMGANSVYEVVLYYGASDTECGRVRVVKNANLDGTMNVPFMTEIIPANSRIRGKVASTNGGETIDISVFYHVY
jgi:hypothetical protein